MSDASQFLNHLSEKRYSPKTITEYSYILNRLQSFLNENGIPNLKDASLQMIQTYFTHSTDTVSKYHYINFLRIAGFYRYLLQQGDIFLSPFHNFSPPRFRKHSHPVLDTAEIERTLSAIRTDHPLCIRGKAVMELAFSSALRPKEIRTLEITDIDFSKGMLFLRQSKGHKDRVVPVGTTALKWISIYLNKVRPRYIGKNTHSSVFISHKSGKPLTTYGLRWAIQQTLRYSGLTPIRPYTLRTTAATSLLDSGMSIYHISALLGHADLRTTQIYLRVSTVRLKHQLEDKHPRHKIEKIIHTRKEQSDEV